MAENVDFFVRCSKRAYLCLFVLRYLLASALYFHP